MRGFGSVRFAIQRHPLILAVLFLFLRVRARVNTFPFCLAVLCNDTMSVHAEE